MSMADVVSVGVNAGGTEPKLDGGTGVAAASDTAAAGADLPAGQAVVGNGEFARLLQSAVPAGKLPKIVGQGNIKAPGSQATAIAGQQQATTTAAQQGVQTQGGANTSVPNTLAILTGEPQGSPTQPAQIGTTANPLGSSAGLAPRKTASKDGGNGTRKAGATSSDGDVSSAATTVAMVTLGLPAWLTVAAASTPGSSQHNTNQGKNQGAIQAAGSPTTTGAGACQPLVTASGGEANKAPKPVVSTASPSATIEPVDIAKAGATPELLTPSTSTSGIDTLGTTTAAPAAPTSSSLGPSRALAEALQPLLTTQETSSSSPVRVAQTMVRLDPPGLGTVEVGMRMEEGVVHLVVRCQQSETVAALRAEAPLLRQALAGSGLRLDDYKIETREKGSPRQASHYESRSDIDLDEFIEAVDTID